MDLIESVDFSILNGIQSSLKCGFLDFLMPLISLIGGGAVWALGGIILLFIKKHRINGIVIISALTAAIIITEFLIKPIFMRERPYLSVESFALLTAEPHGSSFPSAHTSASFASAVPFFGINKPIGVCAVIFAALVGFSRLYLYVHFPSDVICGALLGILIGVLATKIKKKTA